MGVKGLGDVGVARQRVGGDERARHLRRAVDAVGVAGECPDAGGAVECLREAEEEVDIAPAPAQRAVVAWQGDGGLAAGEQDDGACVRGEGFLQVQCLGGELAAKAAGLALDGVALDGRVEAERAGVVRSGLKRLDRGGDQAIVGGGEAGIAGLDAFVGGVVEGVGQRGG